MGGLGETLAVREGVDDAGTVEAVLELAKLEDADIAGAIASYPDLLFVLKPNPHIVALVKGTPVLCSYFASQGKKAQLELAGGSEEGWRAMKEGVEERIAAQVMNDSPHMIHFIERPGDELQVFAVDQTPSLILSIKSPCWQAQLKAIDKMPKIIKEMLDAGQEIGEEALLGAAEKYRLLVSCDADGGEWLRRILGKFPADVERKPGETIPKREEWTPLKKEEYVALKEAMEGDSGEFSIRKCEERYLVKREGGKINLYVEHAEPARMMMYFMPSLSEAVQRKIVEEHGIEAVEDMKKPCEELAARYKAHLESKRKKEEAARKEKEALEASLAELPGASEKDKAREFKRRNVIERSEREQIYSKLREVAGKAAERRLNLA